MRARLRQVVEQVEDFVGVALVATDQRDRWQVTEQEFVTLASEAEELGLHALDYFQGRPQEMAHERRKRIAQKSRVALKFDPLAAAEAQLLADFAFAKGVPIPTARDPQVQDVIREAWTDANNEEKLTGFSAMRKLSNELMTAGELFVTLYTAAGRVRVGRLDADTVEAVVPDPEDRLRPLWYMARVRKFEWDFANDRAKLEQDVLNGAKPKVLYWKHWRNYDDAVEEREKGLVDDGETPLETPPAAKMAKGVVYHVAINQTGEELRGNPPWARSLRFFEAMNVLIEAHVAQAQAASAFVAKRVMKGSPKAVSKAAANILGHVSELGSGRFDPDARRAGESEERAGFAPGGAPPIPPGSWWTENDSSKLEALALSSGSGQMAQTAQIVRSPIAAAAGFGQHYLGDSSDANLATASTLELPATMRVQSWQQYFEDLVRWFTDRAIEAAVKAGRLGGLDRFPEDGPVSEMRLHEAEGRAAMEKRTGKDLSYEFVMPFPGRRQLPEVQAFVQALGQSMDPNGVNVPLRRHLLRFAFEQMGIDDVGRAVDECLPEEGIPGGIGPQTDDVIDPETGLPQTNPDGSPKKVLAKIPGGGPGGRGDGAGPGGERPPNVRRSTAADGKRPVSEQEWIPAELRPELEQFTAGSDSMFSRFVSEPAVLAALQLAGSSNGDGAGH
jgi:hypothetical protein